MGYVQILDRPAGTLGYQQGAGEQMLGLTGDVMEGMTKSMKDMIFRKAIERSSLEPSFEQDKEGNWTVKYSPKAKTDTKDTQFKLQMALAGFSPMDSVMGKGYTEKNTPFELGKSEGGMVGTPPGATAKDGIYYDAQGNEIGTYLEEAGPGKKDTVGYDNVVRQALRKQIAGDEFGREMAGLPKPEKTVEEKAQERVDLENAMEKTRGPGYSTKKAQAAVDVAQEKKRLNLIKVIESMKKNDESPESIEAIIKSEGFSPSDFQEYLPSKNKGFRWPFATNKPAAAAPRLGENIM